MDVMSPGMDCIGWGMGVVCEAYSPTRRTIALVLMMQLECEFAILPVVELRVLPHGGGGGRPQHIHALEFD